MDEKELSKIRKVIKLALIKIGMRCDLTGFTYLCCAVELVVQSPNLIHNLCSGLYSKVGLNCNRMSGSCVERNIRHAIEDTYIEKSFAELNRMFKAQLFTIDDKPTAGQLIKLLAEYYNLGLYKEHLGIND